MPALSAESAKSPAEEVALVDEHGEVVGTASRAEVRAGNLRHAATAVLVRDGQHRIYVHRRTESKDWAPGHWDAAAGGVMKLGEEPLPSAGRELAEELGVEGVELRPLGTHLYEDATTRCFEYAYEATWDGPIRHQPEEVAAGRWIAMEELGPLMRGEAFVPDTAQLLGILADKTVGDYAQLRVFAAARALDLDFQVTRHGRVRSLEEAAHVRGIEPRQIVKTLVVRRSAAQYLFVLVPGDREFDWPRLRAHLGINRISMPDAAAALEVTGYERGTITPLGSRTPCPVLADVGVRGRISLGAGAHGVAVTVDAGALLSALGAEVAEIGTPATE